MQTGQDVVACALGTCPLMFPSGVSLARVCDNAMLRCQNGGTCHHHQRCHCPPGFTGILCERAHCQGSGECDDQLSGQASFNHPPVGRWLARNLVVIPLLIVFLC
ncbi:Netrin-G1 Laminet-1 [Takifugu flavidus]|uniref:Netrin-G1 Laminet-1 n=1 Tax=Takifugu flavidus TaxID=433684 RepID=A0A5C6P461_9TELE|nr:Netrin-G1 Laminet-1 [Takifugu flavidus]